MFTGLIESVGKLKALKRSAQMVQLTIEAHFENIVLGESIAVRGVCLTVVEFGEHYFVVEASSETMSRTNLGLLHVGDFLNLERAMVLGGRMGGHWVMGHIDGVGSVLSRKAVGNAICVEIAFEQSFMRYIVQKGSVTLDGVSLTVNNIDGECFCVMLIPHTQSVVSPDFLTIGSKVNIEVDVLGKYIERLIHERNNNAENSQKNQSLADCLKENGFI